VLRGTLVLRHLTGQGDLMRLALDYPDDDEGDEDDED
jgi:hypothetical protein